MQQDVLCASNKNSITATLVLDEFQCCCTLLSAFHYKCGYFFDLPYVCYSPQDTYSLWKSRRNASNDNQSMFEAEYTPHKSQALQEFFVPFHAFLPSFACVRASCVIESIFVQLIATHSRISLLLVCTSSLEKVNRVRRPTIVRQVNRHLRAIQSLPACTSVIIAEVGINEIWNVKFVFNTKK